MLLKKIIQHGIIITFLVVSLSGIIYTFTPKNRHGLPFVPRLVTYFSYGMMGPWQNYITNNSQIFFEGLRRDGTWEEIDRKTYMPFWHGETGIRSQLWMFIHHFGRRSLPAEYRKYAERLMALEAEKRNKYLRVRVGFATWPKSPESFNALKIPFFTTIKYVADFP